MRAIVCLILAVGFHCAAFFLFRPVPLSESPPQVVDWWPGTRTEGGSTKGANARHEPRWAKLPASALGIGTEPGLKFGAYGVAKGLGESGAPGGSGGGALAQAEQAIRRTPFYCRLHELIDGALAYPDDLYDAGIEGLVKATLVFSPAGAFVRKDSRLESTSGFLKVLVARALRDSLADGIARIQPEGGKALRVECTFEFEIVHSPIFQRRAVGFSETHPFGNERTLETGRPIFSAADAGECESHLHFYRAHNTLSQIALDAMTNEQTESTKAGLRVDVLPWLETGWDAVSGLFSNKAKIDLLEKYRGDAEFRG